MAPIDVVESWQDVSSLPEMQIARADVHFRFPVPVTAKRARDDLQIAGFDVRPTSDELVYIIPNVEPLEPVRSVAGILTPPEREDTFALVLPCGETMRAADQLLAMNVVQLRDRLAAAWLLEMLREKSLTCIFQPIVKAEEPTSVLGYEALMRGNYQGHPISPGRMIQVAKNAHVMGNLDALAMQVALIEAARCGIPGLLFINCSPTHIYEPELRMEEVSNLCGRLGLKPANIVFEVTETESNDPEHLKRFMDACRARGFRVAVDDVGSGYSSLGMMTQLRPDIVKIDRSLVAAINTDPFRALILNRVLDATRILGILTVIEGIETETELAWARNNGATYVQGHLTGAPEAKGPPAGRG